MKETFKSVCCAAALFLAASFPGLAAAALPAAVEGQALPSLAPVLERVTPSVVNVYTQTRVRVRSPLLDDPFFRRFFNIPDTPRERISQSLGSGVIVDSKAGYVLTNNHVISGADDISVTLSDGRSFEAEVIGTDPDTDLAMIRIPAEDLQALPFADSQGLRVGDFVVAVGNPFGLGQTVTSGIVSALGRSAFRGLEFQNFIQTDASINPGNSGGALINLRGELVGINSAIFTPSGGNVGIGFAIPSAMALHVMDQLARFGEVRRGTLGIFVQDLTGDLAGAFGMAKGQGVLVAEVAEGSSAARAGLEAGDVITSIAGYPVGSSQEFHNYEGQFPIGETLELEYVRKERNRRMQVAVEELKAVDGAALDRRLAGARFEQLPLKQRGGRVRGVLLAELEERSLLARRGLRPGDIVFGANRSVVRDLEEFEEVIAGVRGNLVLQVLRDGNEYVVRLD
ncbi:MAG: Do family serine endopeptidase [Xanthomonadales bacterium]|nr:Do family serine endopeptidase [Xanthomonadales bacterium]